MKLITLLASFFLPESRDVSCEGFISISETRLLISTDCLSAAHDILRKEGNAVICQGATLTIETAHGYAQYYDGTRLVNLRLQ